MATNSHIDAINKYFLNINLIRMKADKILKKHEDANEMHFHEVDRKWIIEAMEEYAALRQTSVSGSCQHEFVWLIPDEDDSLDRKCEKCGFVEWHDR